MRLTIKITAIVSLVAGVIYIGLFVHSCKRDRAYTKQTILLTSQKLEERLRSGLSLPTNRYQLGVVLGGVPKDAWGQSLDYGYVAPTGFVMAAISPYGGAILKYDSCMATNGVQEESF